MENEKVKLDSMLRSVLSVANEEQNFFYSPVIYEAQFNVATGLLLSKLARLYPTEQWVIDAIEPFVEKTIIPVTEGYIQLPDNYRNLLGSPQITVKKDKSGECSDPLIIDTEREFKLANLKGKCEKRPIVIVSESEFAYLTTSTYNYPTYWNPIGYFSGQKQITVCPFDIGKVEVLYARQEKQYVYNYILQPDDTFLFNPDGSVESEWTNAAFTPLFNALVCLYSAYAKDGELQNWSMLLTQHGIL